MLRQPAGWQPPRALGAFNGRGFWTLYRREVLRFLRFAVEGLGGPLVSALLFLAVFAVALPSGAEPQPGVAALTFLAPGIAVFSLLRGAFESGGFPVLYDKLEGMIGDVVMAPLSPGEIVAAYVLAAASNGIATGAVVLAVLLPLVGAEVVEPLRCLAFALAGGLLFGLVGFITGLWSEKWDRFSAVDTFVMLPLGLLSGSFFSLESLPPLGQAITRANPVFYIVDGFRSGVTGVASVPPGLGLLLTFLLVLLLSLISWHLVRAGYKIKT